MFKKWRERRHARKQLIHAVEVLKQHEKHMQDVLIDAITVVAHAINDVETKKKTE